MDLTGVVATLLGNGPMGLLALFLWDREGKTAKRHEESQKEFIKELIRINGMVTDGLRASTEGFRSNNEVNNRTAASAAAIAEALRSLETAIEHLQQMANRVESRIENLERGSRR